MIQTSVSLKYEPCSEPLHKSAKQLFLNRLFSNDTITPPPVAPSEGVPCYGSGEGSRGVLLVAFEVYLSKATDRESEVCYVMVLVEARGVCCLLRLRYTCPRQQIEKVKFREARHPKS